MKIITKYLSTALIALLLVLLVCLCFVYMNSYNNVESSEFTHEMDVAVREKSYKSGYVGLLDDTLVSPYFFGYSVGGDKFGYFGQGAGDCYSSFSGVISALFGPESTVSVASETDFYKCFAGDFVYIKYRSELPKSVIYYAQNPDGILEEISDEYVYEMVVSVNNPAFALTRDRMGNCYIYRASQNFLYNKNLLYSYNKFEGGFAFDFAADSEIDASYASLGFYEKINDTAVIRNNSFSAASAVVQPLKTDDGFVLAKFGMNPEKVTSHSASDGVTYYDEGRNVKISTDGTITYAARSILSGIAISEIIGYDILGNDYSFCDYVGAALALAKSLGLDAGDFDLALTCAERNGGDMVIALSYAYKGYTVVTENEYALRIEISGGYITGISCNMYTATAYDGKTSLSDGTWRIRSEIAGYDGDTPIDFRYVYIIKNSRLYLSVMRYGEEGDV